MGKAINMLLLDGTVAGPRTAQIGNWPGRAIFSPVDAAAQVLTRPEFERPGVYILKAPPTKNVFSEQVYIGESEELRSRLKNHLSNISEKPFDSFVAVTSTDNLLNKATVRYLEHKLIELGHANKTSEVRNKTKTRAPRISEGDVFNMDAFLVEMKIILPMLGLEFVTPTLQAPRKELVQAPPQNMFKLKDGQMNAFMYISEGQIIVTKGSQMKKNEARTIPKNAKQIRDRLLAEGLAVEKGNYFELTGDVAFTSTSAASSTLFGRSNAGPRHWIHMAQEITYGEFIELQVK